jgi:cupin fold WbuC family metalloprotein
MSNKEVLRISPAATRSTHERWSVIDRALIQQKVEDAKKNIRKREIPNFHSSDQEALHRRLNCIQPGSYIRLHRHLDPPKDEAFVLLKGSAGFVIFDGEHGLEKKQFALLDSKRGTYGIDIRAGVWHTLFSLNPTRCCTRLSRGRTNLLQTKTLRLGHPVTIHQMQRIS